MAESVSSRDLRAMMDLIRDGYADEPAEGLPAAVGAGLSRLVRCDSICLFELSPGHRHCTGDGCVHDPGLSPVFWTHYRSCPPCSYPERSGDYKSVTKTSDFYSQRQWHSAPMYSEYLRRFGVEDEIVACLPAPPGRSLRRLCAVTAAASPNGTSSWSNCCAPTCTLSTRTPSGAGPASPDLPHANGSCSGWSRPDTATPTLPGSYSCRKTISDLCNYLEFGSYRIS
jgi:hypothetical protein